MARSTRTAQALPWLTCVLFLFSSASADDSCKGEFQLRDLQVESIRVAHQDVNQLLQTLSTLGYETVSIPAVASPPSAAATTPTSMGSRPGYPGSYPGQPGTPPTTSSYPGTTPGFTPPSTGAYTPPGFSRPGQPQQTTQPVQVTAKTYNCDHLPVVVMPPPVDDTRLGFAVSDFLGLSGGSSSGGGSRIAGGSYGSQISSGSVGGDFSPALHPLAKPHSGEVDQLLVFYHQAQEHKLRALENLVRTSLDLPASQIYIEGLVLEVSEDGLKELGVRYVRVDPDDGRSIEVGALGASPVSAGGAGVIDFVRDSLLDTTGARNRSLLQIQALVSNGSAEVLSRPSVLTLSNRQATIQIIDIVQFPIQEATITSSGDIVQSAFKFEAVRPGITLNLRPRVTDDRKHVSMEIDVTVEALVSANNGEVRNTNGDVIATKPGSSTRRVQTFARIPDRTPIIIGGLISTDKETVKNKVPLLSRIPIMGRMFGATKKSVGKREVIIVLTPYVVGQENTLADVSVPKDTSLFDIEDTTLFQDAYRVRAEDVYDMQFLMGSPEFIANRTISEQIQRDDPDRASLPPFNHFLNGEVPGGDKFLNRMVFDMVGRRNFGDEVTFEHLIALRETASGNTEAALFRDLVPRIRGNQALVLVFGKDAEGGATQTADIQIRRLDSSWEEELWDLSYGADGDEQSAIIIRDQDDLDLLIRAVVSSSIVHRNGGYEKLNVGKFQSGTLLSIPSFDTDRFYVVDEKVARVFTDVQHYYRAASKTLEQAYKDMKHASGSDAAKDSPQ